MIFNRSRSDSIWGFWVSERIKRTIVRIGARTLNVMLNSFDRRFAGCAMDAKAFAYVEKVKRQYETIAMPMWDVSQFRRAATVSLRFHSRNHEHTFQR